MKSSFILILTLSFISWCHAQPTHLDWVKTAAEGMGLFEDAKLCIDAANNTYTAGYFRGTINFNQGGIGATISSPSNYDASFVQKTDDNGNLLWLKALIGSSIVRTFDIHVKDNAVYITGYFAATADFDPGVGIFNMTASASGDLFLLKLTANGDFVWAKQIANARGFNIFIDNNDDVFLSGNFRGTTDLDLGVGTANFTAIGNEDYFLSKMDANGDLIWAKHMEGKNSATYAFSRGLELDPQGNITVVGSFIGSIDFDPGTGDNTLATVSSFQDGFVHKLDANGNFLWAKQLKSSSNVQVRAVKVDNNNGDIYTTGLFGGTTDLYPDSTTVTAAGSGFDLFVQRHDSNGQLLWVKTIGALGDEMGNAIDLDSSSNVYIVGTFRHTVDFDPAPNQTAILTTVSPSYSDVFTLKLNQQGQFNWVQQLGGNRRDDGLSIVCKGSDDIYLQGFFADTVDFDPSSRDSIIAAFNHGMYTLHLQESSTVGIDQVPSSFHKIYPNPSTGLVHIELPKEGESFLSVLNQQGKLIVSSQHTTETTALLDLHHLPAGVYYITVATKHTRTISKWIKQ